jgi:hypothetical protein
MKSPGFLIYMGRYSSRFKNIFINYSLIIYKYIDSIEKIWQIKRGLNYVIIKI